MNTCRKSISMAVTSEIITYYGRYPCLLIGIVSAVFFTVFFWSFGQNVTSCTSNLFMNTVTDHHCITNPAGDRTHDPPEKTFYDDPDLSYTIENPVKNWDEKRKHWLKLHPSFAADADDRIFILTGSQPSPCKNPTGDHLLMRCFKNKVDYCRIHGYNIFYNNALLQAEMDFCWAKIPLVRASMIAHPEAEWLLWIDSDAIFTDMDYKIPLRRYRNHNFVAYGSEELLYEKKTWLAVVAGVFLIRNCQWSLDLLDVWASMGPISPNYEQWGKTFSETLTERVYVGADDQSALVYLLVKEKETWAEKVYIENEYSLSGYWVQKVGRYENYTGKYEEIEKRERSLRRRHAEVVSERYGSLWEPYLKDMKDGWKGLKRPFITHFAGCQPCNGEHNPNYKGNSCWVGMERGLNFADNQVIRNWGFVHRQLENGTFVSPLPFDFPAKAGRESAKEGAEELV